MAFARVDETPVKILQRLEIAADGVATSSSATPSPGPPMSPCGWAYWTFAAVP